jgi:hypothetical protein
VAVVSAALLAALLPIPAQTIERLYSAGPYAALQPWVTRASNLTAFAWIDLLAIALTAAWIGLGARDLRHRRSWLRAVGKIGARTIVWMSALYLIFLAAWGLNYRRVPLVDKLAFDESRVSPDAALELGMVAVREANALFERAHVILQARAEGGSGIEPTLAAAFARAQIDLGATRLAVAARPKATLFDLYLQRAGVSGMTDPIFLETLVAGDLLPIERPFVVAHEWGHLAGINDEGEANFAGWLTCVHGSAADQYSGWLFLITELSAAARDADRQAMMTALGPGPREDLRAIARRIQQHVSPRVSAAGWRAYNQYLKANRVERGTASYAEVVKLVLGVPFERDWAPRRR